MIQTTRGPLRFYPNMPPRRKKPAGKCSVTSKSLPDVHISRKDEADSPGRRRSPRKRHSPSPTEGKDEQRSDYKKKSRYAMESKSNRRSRSRSPKSPTPPASPAHSNYSLFDDDFRQRESTPDYWVDKRSITETLALLDTPTKNFRDDDRRRSDSPSPSQQRKKTESSSRRWNEKKLRILCSLWEENPHLYNSNCADYKNKKVRIETIDRISAVMNMESEEVWTRMKSLRTVYRKTLQQKPSGSGYEKLTASEKNILELCSFLKPYLQNREHTSNLPKLSTKSPAQTSTKDCSGDGDEAIEVDGTPKKKQSAKKKEPLEYQVMADISRCMTSVAGMVSHPAAPSHTETDHNHIWAQLLAKKLNKVEEFAAEDFKVETDKKILALMKSAPKSQA